MEKKFQRSLFIFRRDLRIEDNTGLNFALESSERVIPAFIFTPEQIQKNPYRSNHCLRFMIESLQDLGIQLKKKGGELYFFKGEPQKIVDQCCRKLHIDAVIVNQDYTPYSRRRDKKIEKICKERQIPFYSFHDALLHPPEETLKKDGHPYTIFTPYFRNASKQKMPAPQKSRWKNYFCNRIPFAQHLIPIAIPDVENRCKGGRTEALKILKHLNCLQKYGKVKDFPGQEGTTYLSAYLKFTLCSPREIYAAIADQLGEDHELIRSLYWRDFFTSIAYFFPRVFKGSFHPKFDQLRWSNDAKAYQRWCTGTTGFPIVDAGMRELNTTGFMHNRVRMIAASFLIKDLHINWRWGEKYFAQNLIDYDPAVNNGNWQWAASTGCDAQPYFRIFNPWNQQKKFDPDCSYIKKWIPELKSLPIQTIHAWNERWQYGECENYPPPMIDHPQAAKEALRAYLRVVKN